MSKIKPLKSVLFVFAFKRIFASEVIVWFALKHLSSLKGVFVVIFLRLHALRNIVVVASLGLTVLYLLTVTSMTAQAATSSTINFQARLLTAAGSVVPDGQYNVEFKLFTASASSGSSQGSCTGDANCVWVETRTSGNTVRVVDGYLTVNLGSVNAFASTINWDQQLWLTMNIGGTSLTPSWDGEMSPRLQLTAVPYAFRAGTLIGGTGANTTTLDTGTPSGNNTIHLPAASGTVCLQSSSACGFAMSSGSGSYIQNGTSLQTGANFAIQSGATGSVGGLIQGANGQTADLFDVQTWNGATATTVFSISSAGDIGTQNINVAANKSIALASGTGTVTQTLSTATNAAYGRSYTINNTNSGSSSVAVYGEQISTSAITGGAGANAISVFRFLNPTGTGGGNTFSALDFAGTGYTNVLKVNGNAIINGSGLVQNAGIDSTQTYSNLTKVGTLTVGSIGSGFGTISTGNSITTTSGIQGATGTFTGANALTLGTTGTNTGALTFLGSGVGSGALTFIGPSAPSTNTITLPNATGIVCLTSGNCSAAGSGYILDQSSSPGTAQTGNFNIAGTGLLSTLDATGTGTANTLVIGSSASSTGAINIAGSATTGTMTIGGSSETGAITLQSAGIAHSLTGSATAPSEVIKTSTNSPTAFQIQNAGGSTVLNVGTTNGFVGIGTSSPVAPLTVGTLADSTTAPDVANGDFIDVAGYLNSSTNNQEAIKTHVTVQPTADTTKTYSGGTFNLSTNSSHVAGATLQGTNSAVSFSGSGTLGTAEAAYYRLQNTSTGIVSNAYGVLIDTPANAGTLTNTYGLYVGSQSVGTQTNAPYGIYQAGGSDLNLLKGATTISNGSTTAFQVQNAVGTTAFGINTSGDAITIGSGSTSILLYGTITSGAISAIQPGTSNTTETWHALTLQNGWYNKGGIYANAEYRMLPSPEDEVEVVGIICNSSTCSSSGSGSIADNTIIATLPSGYLPAEEQGCVGTTWYTTGSGRPSFELVEETSGNLRIYGVASGTYALQFHCLLTNDVP